MVKKGGERKNVNRYSVHSQCGENKITVGTDATKVKPKSQHPLFCPQMRKVVTPTESNPGHLHTDACKYSHAPNYSERARRIDEYSRLLFPLTFLVFNLFYWSYYLGIN